MNKKKKDEKEEIEKVVGRMDEARGDYAEQLENLKKHYTNAKKVIVSIDKFCNSLKKEDLVVQVWIENHINVFNGLVGNAIRDQAINMNDKMGLQIAKSYSKYLDVLSFKKDNYDALLGFVIHVAVSCNDVKFMNFVADKMVPGNSIKDPVPAFNVACLFAVLDRKDEMLKAIKVAKKLGKRSEEFATEDNFKKYFKDPDFKMTIKGK